MSFTDTSKSNGAWQPITSSWLMPNSSVKCPINRVTAPWLTATAFGVPVEPDVKIPYKMSVSFAFFRIAARRSGSASSFMSASADIMLHSLLSDPLSDPAQIPSLVRNSFMFRSAIMISGCSVRKIFFSLSGGLSGLTGT